MWTNVHKKAHTGTFPEALSITSKDAGTKFPWGMMEYIMIHTYCGRQCSDKETKQNFLAYNYVSGINLSDLCMLPNLIFIITQQHR